jgi:hypothetical protein
MLKLLERLGGGRLSDKVGRNALEQLRFKLARDLRDMAKIEQHHPDLLAPGLFFAWQRHRQLKQVCKGYAAELSRLTGNAAEAILVDALAGLLTGRLICRRRHCTGAGSRTKTTLIATTPSADHLLSAAKKAAFLPENRLCKELFAMAIFPTAPLNVTDFHLK